MRPEESPGPEVPQEPPAPRPQSPEVQALVRHYRARARASRQKRLYLLVGVGALVAGTGLLLGIMTGSGRPTPHQQPSPMPEAIQAAAAPPREAGEVVPPSGPPAAPKARAAAPQPAPPRTGPPAPSPPRPPAATTVSYQPPERLTTLRVGDTKERVFELFGSTVERRNGSLVRIEGMRLRASGRSHQHAQVEVAEVRVADAGTGSLYWFLFGDGQLVGWGRPEEWPATAGRYEVEIDYR
jgi:hypothetical protein